MGIFMTTNWLEWE